MSILNRVPSYRLFGLTAAAIVPLAVPAAQAQPSRGFEQAELAELSPEKRAEVTARATGGNSVREVLEVMFFNTLQIRNTQIPEPATRIVGIDFGRGTVTYEIAGGQLRVARFDKTTLALLP